MPLSPDAAAAVIATRDGQQLIDVGDGQGRVYDEESDVLGPPASIASILKWGYWEDAT